MPGGVIVGRGHTADYHTEAFRWTTETGVLFLGHMPGDDPPPAFKSRVPPEWNNKSKQEIEIKKEGPFKFNFDIVSKKK